MSLSWLSPPASLEEPGDRLANHHPDTVDAVTETYSVGELCKAVRTVVEDTFPDEVWVTGAISDLKRPQNGHVYFNLVDADDGLGTSPDALIPVALFAKSKSRVNAILRRTGNIRMRDGVEIRIRGQIVYYPPQGRIQLVMSLIDPAYTVGQMALARQVLLDKLVAEGLLNANGALEMPALPLRIGLVTSDRSAAHADFMHELTTSGYRFDVTLFDSRVQGLDAVISLVDGIERAGRSDLDVVVVVRGGGAKTDLAAFDHEKVARAIAACPRPVVVGVGHEIDRSVADEVANTSAKTPTAAAALIVDAVESFDYDVEQAASRLITLATNRLDIATGHLTTSGNRLLVAATTAATAQRNLLDARTTRLRHQSERFLERSEATLDQAGARLKALDPAEVLARGWSITHTEDGSLVRGPADAPAGSAIVTTTAGGTVTSTVQPAAQPPQPTAQPQPDASHKASDRASDGAKSTGSGDTGPND